MFEFRDRVGNNEILSTLDGETAADVLIRHHIPPASVVVCRDGEPIADACTILPRHHYTASLIEGYDIRLIRAAYKMLSGKLAGDNGSHDSYTHRRLSFSRDGALIPETLGMDLAQVARYVEQTIRDTCLEFSLIAKGDGLLIGLSGGVDSSSLALALSSIREYLPNHRLVAVTFEDYDSVSSPTYRHAAELASSLGVEHHVAPASLACEIFHLNRPLREILPRLMETADAHQVMYIDHHTTRRALEVFAERSGLSRICLGLHATDLIAGLLDGWMTGYDIAPIPLRLVGDTTYIYPLAFVAKRELHLYHLYRTGHLARHSSPNAWELRPSDRNFYYYLADMLQAYWPGLELMLFTAHKWRQRRVPASRYERCQNCGSALLHQPFTGISSTACDACMVFEKHGYIE